MHDINKVAKISENSELNEPVKKPDRPPNVKPEWAYPMDEKIQKLEDELQNLDDRLKKLEKKERPLQKHWIYLVLFGIIVVFTGFLVARGWAEKPSVSIDYNVGEIIGGLLLGVAALIGAVTYLRKSIKSE
ncbi:MAG: hypothetical protein DKINENOH_04779 [bacterium]|nr:hypothetical protein [bacterium]